MGIRLLRLKAGQTMNKTYEKPDVSEWAEDDPRRQITSIDEEELRAQYNEWMPPEQPALEELPGLTVAEEMLAEEAEKVGGHALDIGCGNGKLLVTLAKRGYIETGIGIDISDAMIIAAQQTAENLNADLVFHQAAFESFSTFFFFDIIIATEVLEHIYALRDMVAKASRLLNVDGVFVGATPLEHTCDAVVHLHYFTTQSLGALLSPFFRYVHVESVDITGDGEYHIVFICRNPREVMDE